MTEKQYEGPCYIAVVGPEDEIGECRDSIQNINKRAGDSLPRFIRATKGYEARQSHFTFWLTQTDMPFMLLLDSDMVYPQHTLERLRAHGLPYISGFYMRRRYNPIAPVWFDPPRRSGNYPMRPWSAPVEPNKLYELGAAGWGCILIHREVAEKTALLLKGEDFVIEDDMDIYPYDLDKIMAATKELSTLAHELTLSATYIQERLLEISTILSEEIKPLRGTKDPVGSDIRFPFYARLAGYKLYGDSGVRCGHMLHYPVSPFDFDLLPEDARRVLAEACSGGYRDEVHKHKKRMAELKS